MTSAERPHLVTSIRDKWPGEGHSGSRGRARARRWVTSPTQALPRQPWSPVGAGSRGQDAVGGGKGAPGGRRGRTLALPRTGTHSARLQVGACLEEGGRLLVGLWAGGVWRDGTRWPLFTGGPHSASLPSGALLARLGGPSLGDPNGDTSGQPHTQVSRAEVAVKPAGGGERPAGLTWESPGAAGTGRPGGRPGGSRHSR